MLESILKCSKCGDPVDKSSNPGTPANRPVSNIMFGTSERYPSTINSIPGKDSDEMFSEYSRKPREKLWRKLCKTIKEYGFHLTDGDSSQLYYLAMNLQKKKPE